MNVQNKILFSCAVAMMLCNSLEAVTLNQAVSETIKKNPGIKSKLNAYKQEIEAYKIAKASYSPTLNFETSFGKETTNSKSTSYKDVSTTPKTLSLVANQKIFDGFGSKYKIEQANHDVFVSAYDYIGVANEIISSVVDVYLDVLVEKEILAIKKESYQTHENMFNDMKKKYDAGLGNISDVNELKSKLALAYADYISQEQALDEKIIQFTTLYGDLLDISAFEKNTGISVVLPATIEEATKLLIENNPNIKMKEFELKSINSANMIAKKDFYPKVDLKLSKTQDIDKSGTEGITNATSAFISLSYNLYNGGIDESTVQKSLSKVLQKQEDLAVKKQEEIKELQLSYIKKEMTEKKLSYLNTYVMANNEKLLSYKEEFELGRKSLLEVLGAEDDYNSAKKQLVRAVYEYDKAKYKILYSFGTLLSTFNVALENDFITPNYDVDLAKYVPDVISTNKDNDNDKIKNDIDLCPNSSIDANATSVLTTGCLKSLDEYKSTLKTIETLNDLAKEKDMASVNSSTSSVIASEQKSLFKRYKLKKFAFLRDSINGNIEYLWPKDIIIEGVLKDNWIEVKTRLGRKGEVFVQVNLWIDVADVDEIQN